MSTPQAKLADAIPVVQTSAQRDAMRGVYGAGLTRVHNLETGAIERWDGAQWVQDVPYPAASAASVATVSLSGIAVVADQAGRTATYPSPAAGNRVQRLDTGYIERFDGAAWRPEGVTRAAGPIVGSMAKGCHADGATNDGPVLDQAGAFGTAITAVGIGELDVGVHYTSSNCTIPGHLRPLRGAWLQPANGVNITISGTVHDVPFAWIDLSQGGTVTFTGAARRRIRAEWFKDITVSVPAPTGACTVVIPTGLANANRLTAGHTYAVSTTVKGHTGETGASAETTFVAKNSEVIGVWPKYPSGLRGVGFRAYIRDTGGGSAFQADFFNGFGNNQFASFGDVNEVFGSVPAGFNNANPVSPGATNNSLDADGNQIPTYTDPNRAPALLHLGALPQATNFYFKIAYLLSDGTFGPLGPVSAVATTSGSGCWLRVQMPQEKIPRGAYGVGLFASTDGVNFHLQQFQSYIDQAASGNRVTSRTAWPLHHATLDFHDYDSAGAVPNPGSALSTINGLQQAYDALVASGGVGCVAIGPGYAGNASPVILDAFNNGVSVRIEGEFGSDANGTVGAVPYIGPAVSGGAEHVVVMTKSLTVQNVMFSDPNNRVRWGVFHCDRNGAQAFQIRYESAGASANAKGGIGGGISVHSAGNSGSHTASEIVSAGRYVWQGSNCAFTSGGGQTQNVIFTGELGGLFGGGDNDAFGSGTGMCCHSADIKIISTPVTVEGKAQIGCRGGEYAFFLSDAGDHPLGGHNAQLVLRGSYSESHTTTAHFIHCSSRDGNGSLIDADRWDVGNQTGHKMYDLYMANNGDFKLGAPQRAGNLVRLEHSGAGGVTLVRTALTNPANHSNATTPDYADSQIRMLAAPIGFISPAGVEAKLFRLKGTKAAVDPASLAAGASQLVTTVTVTGAVIGDKCISVEHSGNNGCIFEGVVTANDTVTVYQRNPTAGALDVPSGTLTVIVEKTL